MDDKIKSAVAELERAWLKIKNDQTRGASELLRTALRALQDFLKNIESSDYMEIDSFVNELANLRRDMVGFSNCARTVSTENIDDLNNSVYQLLEYLDQAPNKIADHAEKIVMRPASILTMSRSSVVEHIILRLERSAKLLRVIQLESRPALEGRLNAERLLDHNINVTVIPDAAIGFWIDSADYVFVGADAVAVDGSFMGKIGCHPLALMAQKSGVPFYVAAERLKFVHELMAERDVNQNFSGDMVGWGMLSEHLTLSNIIFERTPGDLVSGYITEFGLQKPPLSVLETLSF
jgi:translation initiation factor 2B subunit (eIF-2B alpha/beta/delta family)